MDDDGNNIDSNSMKESASTPETETTAAMTTLTAMSMMMIKYILMDQRESS